MMQLFKPFSDLDLTGFSMELGGILFTPSAFINCLISSQNKSIRFSGSLLNVLGRSADFLLNGYMLEIDKNIVIGNLNNAKKGGYITPEKIGIIEGALNSIKTIDFDKEIEFEANMRSSDLALYDARRLEAAFQYDLTLLTSEPQHFTFDADELNHIFRYGYADVKIGSSINIDTDELTSAKLWIFKPETLARFLHHFSCIDETNREMLLFIDEDDFEVVSNNSISKCQIKILVEGNEQHGYAEETGPIDAVLRAVEEALKDILDLRYCDVHHRVSDTTVEKDIVQVHIRLNIGGQTSGTSSSTSNFNCFEATDESENMLLSTARAYVKALNVVFRDQQFR